MEPISNFGKFGRLVIVILGIGLLAWGIFSTIDNKIPDNADECQAVITGFIMPENNSRKDLSEFDTLVSYSVNGRDYYGIRLGQYEASWKTGDTITVYYDKNDPEKIQTKTKTYGGWLFMLASIPFIVIGLFSLISVRRRAAKTVDEIAEDEERTTAGKLKYKASSILYTLSAGIPCVMIGVLLYLLEHRSVLALLFFVMGCISTFAGVRSIVKYFIIKYRRQKETTANDE